METSITKEVQKQTVEQIKKSQPQSVVESQKNSNIVQVSRQNISNSSVSYVSSTNTVPKLNISLGASSRKSAQTQKLQDKKINFDDDEPIIQKVQHIQPKPSKMQIEIKAQRTMIKAKEEILLPAMCSLKASGGQRTSVDLICVIDVSGSMSGVKIQLVIKTMNYLMGILHPQDRLSIITFNQKGNRLCGLKSCGKQNFNFFINCINSLQANGGTSINSGMSLALKTLKDRKYRNQVSSIFLLSDGQDKGADIKFQQILKYENIGDIFSIHSFGFGYDHDQDLMTNISQLKDGGFYFIKQLQTLDEAFCNAFVGITTVVCNEAVIQLDIVAKGAFEGVKITKTYGNMWQKISQNEYKIKTTQVNSGISKDYVFQLKIPAINCELADLNRSHNIIQVILTGKGPHNYSINCQQILSLIVLDQNQDIPQNNENLDVIQNHLRVLASEAIKQSMRQANNYQFQLASNSLSAIIKTITTHKVARKQKMQPIISDLITIKQKCSKEAYQHQGKKIMTSLHTTHSRQVNFTYSSTVQRNMVSQRIEQKSYPTTF